MHESSETPRHRRPHPDDVRDQLRDCGSRLSHAQQEHDQAIRDAVGPVAAAQDLGMTVTEIASLLGMTRATVYSLLRRGRPASA